MSGALHYTSADKLNTELGWESIKTRAEFLGLCIFHKIHLNETRPLIRQCMPDINYENRLRSQGSYKSFPYISVKYSNSFFPHFTKRWNDLPRSIRNKQDMTSFKSELKLILKPQKYKHFSRGTKLGNSLLTQIRVGRSELNEHRFTIGQSDTSACWCSHPSDSPQHYLLDCFLFSEERRTLFGLVENISPSFERKTRIEKLNILLYGINNDNMTFLNKNVKITLAVQDFILKTKRFCHQVFPL